MVVEPLSLRVELIGVQRNEDGDIHAIAPMWEGQVLPAQFGELENLLGEVLVEHGAERPASMKSRFVTH